MSNTMSIQQAAANLPQLVGALGANDEIILTDGDRPVARIVAACKPVVERKPGSARGTLTVISDDDDHLDDFKEYIP